MGKKIESNRWRDKHVCECARGVDLWHSVEFRELLVQVEFGHLGVEDPRRTICVCVSMHV